MTVTEAVKLSGLTPSADYTGVETTDDFLLAVQTEASQTDVKNWVVCADHVREHSGALNASTTDNTYIRTGPVTTKGSVQRTLSIQGDRYVGDAFQDFLLSHKIAFGSGQSVVVPYVYFSLCTGKGEKGEGALILTAMWAAAPARMPPLPPISRASAPRLSSTITPPSRAERKEHR